MRPVRSSGRRAAAEILEHARPFRGRANAQAAGPGGLLTPRKKRQAVQTTGATTPTSPHRLLLPIPFTGRIIFPRATRVIPR
jgi:hypothetical protein